MLRDRSAVVSPGRSGQGGANLLVTSVGALRAARWFALLTALTACSISVDADRHQCVTSEDCARRGPLFADAICENFVCEPRAPTGEVPCQGEGCTPAPSACDGASCDASTMRPSDADARSATRPDGRVDASREAGPAGRDDGSNQVPTKPPGTDPGEPAEKPPSDAGPVEPTADAAPPPADAAASKPRECAVDDDCARLGKVGAKCLDELCWEDSAGPRCESDMDCPAHGPEYIGGRCLEQACMPNPRFRCDRPSMVTSKEPLPLDVFVRDSLSLNPLRELKALVCQKLDLTCAEPVSEVITGSDGHLRFEVPRDFAGYLQFQDRRYMPALYFFPPVLPDDGKLQPAPLLGTGVVDGLAVSLGSRLDPMRGHLMLVAEDCLGMPLPGVVFQSDQRDAKTIQFYVRDLLPSTSAKETGEIGNGGYLNFPAGTAVINVKMVKNDLKLTTMSVVIRPGFITVAYVRPDAR
jgi:hypothetical protein